MAQGLTFESFAGVIGINKDSLYEWAKRHPRFSEAQKKGEEAGRHVLEKIGISLALGKVKGSAAVWIFMMKNRYKWKDKHEIEHSGMDGGAIQFELTPTQVDDKAQEILSRIQSRVKKPV